MQRVPAYAVFLDRDGTLIRHKPYLGDPREVEVLPGVVEGLRTLKAAGCFLFLHTNQSGVGRGLFSLADAVACNDEMLRQLDLGRDLFADICICPEVPDGPIQYRKPSPRYGLETLAKFGLDTTKACYVGDNVSDLQTARHIGCLGVGVDTGGHELYAQRRNGVLPEEIPIFDDFVAAARCVVERIGITADGR